MSREITFQSRLNKRFEQLINDRSGMMNYWAELADNILFHRGRFLSQKQKRNTSQINNTPRRAARTLGSGMMAGISSPARPWFMLATANPDLMERARVKEWLRQVQSTMYRVLSASNTYNSLHALYGELGTFGTGAIGVYTSFKNVIQCETYTIGSYALGQGANNAIDTFGREYQKTVMSLVKTFGEENVSEEVRRHWEKGNLNAKIKVRHLIEPNDNRNAESPLARDKNFRSCYWEVGQEKKASKFLRRSGFNTDPILTPRWDVADGEIYSEDCPGMIAIGDCKGLQLGERRKYQALDKVANPPLQGDSALKNKVTGGQPRPGSVTWHSANSKGLRSIYEGFQPRLDLIQEIQKEVEARIEMAYYVDLFLMLAHSDRRQITAREIAEKHEEKLLMLGPVLERLHAELLDPLINRIFDILQENGILPPPPPELINSELRVEYVSVLAQAQRMVGLNQIERTVGFAIEMATIWPEARHKVDPLQAIDEYAQDSGANPKIIRPDEEVMEMVQQERQARQQQQQLAETGAAASNLKDIAAAQQSAGAAEQMRAAGLA